MTGRVPCCVPGCRRSFRSDGHAGDVMCGRCFRLADGGLQDRYKTLKRRARRLDRLFERLPTLKKQPHSRLARGYERSATYLEAAFEKALSAAWNAIKADAEIKLAVGAPGAPRRKTHAPERYLPQDPSR